MAKPQPAKSSSALGTPAHVKPLPLQLPPTSVSTLPPVPPQASGAVPDALPNPYAHVLHAAAKELSSTGQLKDKNPASLPGAAGAVVVATLSAKNVSLLSCREPLKVLNDGYE